MGEIYHLAMAMSSIILMRLCLSAHNLQVSKNHSWQHAEISEIPKRFGLFR